MVTFLVSVLLLVAGYFVYAFFTTPAKVGIATPTSIAITAITMTSSKMVNPRLFEFRLIGLNMFFISMLLSHIESVMKQV